MSDEQEAEVPRARDALTERIEELERDKAALFDRLDTADQLNRELVAQNERLRKSLAELLERSAKRFSNASVYVRARAALASSLSETEEKRNPQERAELSPYASMAREEAAAWADHAQTLFNPDDEDAALRRAEEAVARRESHPFPTHREIAATALDASGVWNHIRELRAENKRLRDAAQEWRDTVGKEIARLVAENKRVREVLRITAVCPTPCDDDCEAECHEGHDIPSRRIHQPEDCPSRFATLASSESEHALREMVREAEELGLYDEAEPPVDVDPDPIIGKFDID